MMPLEEIPYEETFAMRLPGGSVIDGAEFVDQVCGKEARFFSHLISDDPIQVCLQITQALAFGFDLEIPDSLVQGSGTTQGGIPLQQGRAKKSAYPDLKTLVGAMEHNRNGNLRMYTSGTTGRPKSVFHNFQSLTRGLQQNDAHRHDRWAMGYDPTHIAGIQVFLQALLNGNPLLFLHRCPPDQIADELRKHDITHISATPTFYRLLPTGLKDEKPLTGVKRITTGGEQWDPHLPERLRPLFPSAQWRNIYATTETGHLFTAADDTFTVRPESLDCVRVSDGKLLISHTALGQFDFAGEWYDTGDLVDVVSEDPLQIRFLRRTIEEINIGGYKVHPPAVESILREHPAVRNARVYARENKVTGKILMADIVFTANPIPDRELRNFLSNRLHPYHIPRVFRTVEQLDQTRSGKIKR